MKTDILVLGGGASGLAAAITAKVTAPEADVRVAEALDRCGKKLLATGNGRCNIMNALAAPESYLCDRTFVSPALDLYRQCWPAFWDALGVPLAVEGEGRMYPLVNQASAVLDALRLRLSDLGIEETTGFRAARIEKRGDGFTVSGPAGEISCKKLIVATGGKAGKGLGENDSFVSLLKPFGHSFTRLYPALTCLKTEKRLLNGLKGVRLRGEISLWQGNEQLKSEVGEILFQDDGLSGIAAMQLSLTAAPLIGSKELYARLSPLKNAAEALKKRVKLYPRRQAQQLLAGTVNRMIALNALKRAGIGPTEIAGTLTEKQLEALAEALDQWCLPVVATGSFAEAQVMLGGANTKDFDSYTLESQKARCLYAAGELLDVTGPCGGYNLEWAWASGILAGQSAAKALTGTGKEGWA